MPALRLRCGGPERPSGRRLLRAVLDARWALLAPVIVLGGIYGGIFTPTEASVVAAVYGLFVGSSSIAN